MPKTAVIDTEDYTNGFKAGYDAAIDHIQTHPGIVLPQALIATLRGEEHQALLADAAARARAHFAPEDESTEEDAQEGAEPETPAAPQTLAEAIAEANVPVEKTPEEVKAAAKTAEAQEAAAAKAEKADAKAAASAPAGKGKSGEATA
jgi:hypothetical protein